MSISIKRIDVKASLDTGSEITCIFQEFYKNYSTTFNGKSSFPICGKDVKCATSDNTTRSKRQVLLNVEGGDSIMFGIFIVVRKLIEKCTIDSDSLKGQKMRIHNNCEEIDRSINQTNENFFYKETPLDKDSLLTLWIVYDEFNELTREQLAVDFDSKSSEELTVSEIDLNVYDCHNLSTKDNTILADLLIVRKYHGVFNKKPGTLTTNTHNLTLKDDQPFNVKPYPILINFKNKVRIEVKKMFKFNIVRHSTSSHHCSL